MISRVIHLVRDLIVAPLEVGSKLTIILVNPIHGRATKVMSGLAFVAITSWSRMPRFSAHSPINSSELSS